MRGATRWSTLDELSLGPGDLVQVMVDGCFTGPFVFIHRENRHGYMVLYGPRWRMPQYQDVQVHELVYFFPTCAARLLGRVSTNHG